MRNTERYREQHAEIMRLAGDLSKRLVPASLAADGAQARAILADLSGKLFVHLAAEDNVLYPKLLKSPDPEARAVAQRFAADMLPISKAFKAYAVRWGSARTIQADVQAFIKETREMLGAYGERVRREHAELYSLADSLPS